MSSLLIAGKTDVGQRRQDNQDTFICTPIWSDDSVLLAAIDGVGGYAGGDRAAAIARESIEKYMATPNGDPLSMLREAVVFANNQINQERQQTPQLAQMACVLTTAVADSRLRKVYYVHVGDTRMYRFRGGVLEKITRDHSLVGIREDANELTEAEAMQHPRRNEILRDVGSLPHRVDDRDFLESGETDFEPGDVLLLCSDGLTDMITQAQIRAVLGRKLPLDAQATELIRVANQQGGKDNITVVLAQNSTPASPASAVTDKTVHTVTQPVPPVRATEKTVPADPKPAKRGASGLWILLFLLLIGAGAGIWWYQYQPSSVHQEARVDSLNTVTPQPDTLVAESDARLDSLVQQAHRSPNHQLTLPADTFRLTEPLVLTDSLQRIMGGNPLTVLLPADTARAQVALQITRSGPVQLQNMLISGFKKGIETTQEARIQLSNVYFRNVEIPVSAAVRQDTFRNAVLGVSVQNLLESTQPTRR
ncbi:serine/threonine protein phosphatase PrpC [Larkinella arboricola]|uniref:Serine/threonine protein phosphatase PrpC n=1 Tax=Larkinella arboricola TaxID=643671 RepID=A0A327X0X9_LARAB|nr:protein phosphatase 2C domain-containing protein [Larkinella arboricola]RAJ99987.1 serine/threonine protein phosphatase PrpC [Larkinella arboricola]